MLSCLPPFPLVVIFAFVLLIILSLEKTTKSSPRGDGPRIAGAATPSSSCDPKSKTPYYDSVTSKCVECLIDNNCILGFQRCFQGVCVKKNSPQCVHYPYGLLGGNDQFQKNK